METQIIYWQNNKEGSPFLSAFVKQKCAPKAVIVRNNIKGNSFTILN